MANVIVGAAEGPWGRQGNQSVLGNVDPFSMMNSMMDFKQKQQQFNANQEFGNLATQFEGNPDGLSKAAQASPYAAYLQDKIEALNRTTFLAAQTKTQEFTQKSIEAQTAGVNFKTGRDVYDFALQNSLGDKDRFNALLAAGAAKLPQDVQGQVMPWLYQTSESLTGGLDPDPQKAKAQFASRAFKSMVLMGHDPQQVSTALTGLGPLGLTESGGAQYVTGQILDPSQRGLYVGGERGGQVVGPGITPGGEPVQPGQPNQLGGTGPQIGAGGEVSTGEPTPTPKTTAPAVGPPTRLTPPDQTTAAPAQTTAPQQDITTIGGHQYHVTSRDPQTGRVLTVQPVMPGEQVTGPTTAAPAPTTAGPHAQRSMFDPVPIVPPTQAGDGKPLYPGADDPAAQMFGPKPPGIGAGFGGRWPLYGSDADEEKTQREAFGKIQGEFANDQLAMGNLRTIEADVNRMQQSDNKWLRPGAYMEERGNIANNLNTLANVLGWDVHFDAQNLAAKEQLTKTLAAMNIQLAKSTFGGQKEAFQTIDRIGQSLPSLTNSFLGSKLVVASVRAMLQRSIDQVRFTRLWMKDHGGTMLGAGEAFSAIHPMENYVNAELAPFGLDSTMKFRSPQVVLDNIRSGVLSPDDGAKIMAEQFPKKD